MARRQVKKTHSDVMYTYVAPMYISLVLVAALMLRTTLP